MTVTGFGGPYVLPAGVESQADHVVHICAGSGIVPNMSIIRHCLETGVDLRHTLIYGNKTWDDIIFRRQFEELAARHPGKLDIVHALSREADVSRYGPNVRTGRVSEALLREHIPDPAAAHVFTCGPGIGKFERQAAREGRAADAALPRDGARRPRCAGRAARPGASRDVRLGGKTA
jgi:ferredoxin-NADP reductase